MLLGKHCRLPAGLITPGDVCALVTTDMLAIFHMHVPKLLGRVLALKDAVRTTGLQRSYLASPWDSYWSAPFFRHLFWRESWTWENAMKWNYGSLPARSAHGLADAVGRMETLSTLTRCCPQQSSQPLCLSLGDLGLLSKPDPLLDDYRISSLSSIFLSVWTRWRQETTSSPVPAARNQPTEHSVLREVKG